MAKGAYISRYLVILKYLKQNRYPKMDDIIEKIKNSYEYMKEINENLKMGISKRTIERDFKEIRFLYEINIEYCRKNKGYFINDDRIETSNFYEFLENFEILNTIKMNAENMPYVYMDTRVSIGIENFSLILEAIKKERRLQFSHLKYWDNIKTSRIVIPLALKEFKNRWYLIALEDDKIRTFGIDRISEIKILTRFESKNYQIDVQSLFKNSFGIIYGTGKLEEVLLSYPPEQARYVESLPLHSSQKLISKDENEVIFSYQIYVTFDFEQEIIGLGSRVKVLQPEYLAKKIGQEHKNAYLLYSNR